MRQVSDTVQQKANRLHDAAIAKANKSQYESSLRMFMQAAHAWPTNAVFLNNVAVTLMRLHDYRLAKLWLERALEIDPNEPLAADNLRDVEKYFAEHPAGHPGQQQQQQPQQRQANSPAAQAAQAEHRMSEPAAMPQAPPKYRHTLRRLPRLTLAELRSARGLKYQTGQFPFLITDAAEQPSWRNAKWRNWDLQYFVDVFGDQRVDFYPYNMEVERVSPLFANMTAAIQELKHPTGKFEKSVNNPNTSYIQWNIHDQQWNRLIADLGPIPPELDSSTAWIQDCLPKRKRTNSPLHLTDQYGVATHWRMVLIGNQGAGMFNHWDVLHTASYQFQAVGRKQWHICPPSEWDYMNGAGGANTFYPDYDRVPQLANADCYLDVVGPGQFVYYPKDYWHQTYNMDPTTISFTDTLFNFGSWRDGAKEFALSCSDQGGRVGGVRHHSPALCQHIESACTPWWQHGFAGAWASTMPGSNMRDMLQAGAASLDDLTPDQLANFVSRETAHNGAAVLTPGVGSDAALGTCNMPAA